MSRLKYAVDELDHLVTESFSEKVIDLRSKGCQTDSSTCQLSDPHETFQAQTDLTLSKVKIVELTNEVKKEKVEKAGLLEKVISEKVTFQDGRNPKKNCYPRPACYKHI